MSTKLATSGTFVKPRGTGGLQSRREKDRYAHMQNNLDFGGRINAEVTRGGIRIYDDYDPAKESFGFSMAGNVVTIYAGNLRIHGIANISVAETDVELSMDPEWIYIQRQHGGSTATIESAKTEPETDGTYLKIPLYKFQATNGVYYLEKDVRMDINLATPQR